MFLEKIEQANDIKKLVEADYGILAEEIREFLIQSISETGGHLGSNLGAVELTMALHLFLNLPEDKIIWDVGHGQLDWKLRNDERVVCMEKTNFRYVTAEAISEEIDFASVDVSFISLTKILLPARNLLRDGGSMVCLIKPQFEAGKDKVGKKGVVREPQIHEEVVHKVIDYADMIGFDVKGLTYSPIKGPEGNIEYLVYIEKRLKIPEEIMFMTESEAESALHSLIDQRSGKSYDDETEKLITDVVADAHGILDEAK